MRKVLITTSSFGDDAEVRDSMGTLTNYGITIVLNPFGKTLSETELMKLIDEHRPVGIIAGVEPITGKALKDASDLKVISRCGIDTSNIDIKSVQNNGISIYNTPDAPTESVAEMTVALMLNLIRKVCEADRSIRSGRWKKFMGRLLGSMTVGIIGCGRIGTRVAEYLAPFDCTVIGSDILTKAHGRIKMVSLTEILKLSDIITLHVPLTEGTTNMVNRDFIDSMKKGSYLINVSRGDVVDEDALIYGLETERLAGCALDTFKTEPYSGVFVKFENVILTAHMGSYAKEARVKMEKESIGNLIKGLKEAGIL